MNPRIDSSARCTHLQAIYHDAITGSHQAVLRVALVRGTATVVMVCVPKPRVVEDNTVAHDCHVCVSTCQHAGGLVWHCVAKGPNPGKDVGADSVIASPGLLK